MSGGEEAAVGGKLMDEHEPLSPGSSHDGDCTGDPVSPECSDRPSGFESTEV